MSGIRVALPSLSAIPKKNSNQKLAIHACPELADIAHLQSLNPQLELSTAIIYYLQSGALSPAQFIADRDATLSALELSGVQKYVANGQLSIEKIMATPDANVDNLNLAGVQKYLGNQKLTLDLALDLNYWVAFKLDIPAVQTEIDAGRRSLAQILQTPFN